MEDLKTLLLQKYDPTNPALRTSGPSPKPAVKSYRVIMDATEVDPDLIEIALVSFNKLETNKPNMSKNFILPAAIDGIAAGSWVTFD